MFNILAPIFGLIVIAFASRRVNILGPNAYVELNRFVASLALPALIFDNVAHVTPAQLNQPGFVASFGIGAFAVFALPVFVARGKRAFGDRALDGLSACYPNTGYIGLPLAFLAYGPSSAPGATIAAVFTACGLFGFAIALLEWDLHRGHVRVAADSELGKVADFASPARLRPRVERLATAPRHVAPIVILLDEITEHHQRRRAGNCGPKLRRHPVRFDADAGLDVCPVGVGRMND